MEEKVILQEAVDFGLVGKKFTVYGLDPNDNTLERATITTAFYLAYLNMHRNSDPRRFHNYSDLKAYLASSNPDDIDCLLGYIVEPGWPPVNYCEASDVIQIDNDVEVSDFDVFHPENSKQLCDYLRIHRNAPSAHKKEIDMILGHAN